ncbi:MAG: helix-turn-helix domain-containing protein [Acidimicrobiales bacterium]
MNEAGYGQYCPIARALEVLGARWTLLVVRELLLGATRLDELTGALPGASRRLLTRRLAQLREAGVVQPEGDGFRLTEAGYRLEPIVFGLGDWGARYRFGPPRVDELDPLALLWSVHRQLDTAALPGPRTIIAVELTDDDRRFWIAVGARRRLPAPPPSAAPVDVTVTASLPALFEVWMGRTPLADALEAGTIGFGGPAELADALRTALRPSPVAAVVRAAGR